VDYLPWWLGGCALTAVSVGFWLLEGRTLGVSGSLERVLHWKADREARQTEVGMVENQEAMQAAMLAATKEAFGDDVASAPPETPRADAPQGPSTFVVRPPGTVHLTFLLCLALGGVIGAAIKGTLAARASLGADFEGFFGAGPKSYALLVIGGVLVGFGTRMAGGCTSGHGLVGCARLQPGSLLATGVFFGTGIGVAYLLQGVFA
jgi:hypothetical protein